MDELLRQIERSLSSGSYLLSLYTCLALPDICGALESHNGEASGNRYKGWFNRWVAPKYDGLMNGDQCYAYRNGVLHQGRAKHRNLGYKRIIFLEPNPNLTFHRNIFSDALNIDLTIFCNDLISSVREWLQAMKGNSIFEENYAHFMKRNENGISPYIIGVPVIG